MTANEIITLLDERFSGLGRNTSAIDPFVIVPSEQLLEVMKFLRDDDRTAFDILNCVTGVDYLEIDPKKKAKAGFEPHLEVVYHLSSYRHRHRFTVKVLLPRWKGDRVGDIPEVPSVAQLWPTADWHERETYDLCGVHFVGHPDLRRILMSEDWEGYPLRKDYEFPLEYHGVRCR